MTKPDAVSYSDRLSENAKNILGALDYLEEAGLEISVFTLHKAIGLPFPVFKQALIELAEFNLVDVERLATLRH